MVADGELPGWQLVELREIVEPRTTILMQIDRTLQGIEDLPRLAPHCSLPAWEHLRFNHAYCLTEHRCQLVDAIAP